MTSLRRADLAFLVLMAAALALRLHMASTQPYIHDEENNAIPLSRTISLTPGEINLPIRGENHLALPAYVVKASGELFGATRFGYRVLHIVAGIITIALIYLIARQWYGPAAALWAAAILGFNEYYLAVTSRATAHAPQLVCIAAAMYAFSRFMAVQRPIHLYAAGLFVGIAFYAKEHSALLLPVFFAVLLHKHYRHWLRTPHAYLACAVFVLVISPDLLWNVQTGDAEKIVNYGDQPARQATYTAHLQRLGGVGFSPYPAMFYARDGVQWVSRQVTGEELYDETPEYASVNTVLGLLLVGAAAISLLVRAKDDRVRIFLLALFWGLFAFFTLIKKGDPPGRLSPVSWMWVEMSVLPAILLLAARLAGARGALRVAAWSVCAAALVYSVAWTLGLGAG